MKLTIKLSVIALAIAVGMVMGAVAMLMTLGDVKFSRYERIVLAEMEGQLYDLWTGRKDSVIVGKMVIQRVKGNEVIVDRVDTRFAVKER